ncbi:MAG: TVP38/TMEM64 family protein [Elainellaceae cyanobacterium]
MLSTRISTKLLGTLFLLGVVLACLISPLRTLLDVDALVKRFDELEMCAVKIFVLAHIIAAAIGLPSVVLVIVGGAVFGLVWGTVWSVIGATLGAIAAFMIARYLMRDWIEQRFGRHRALKWLNQAVTYNAISCVLAIRFTPISPFNVVNFLLGLTSITMKPYIIGTAIGIIPGTFAYTWLGVTGSEAMRGEEIETFILALMALIGLSVLPAIARKYYQPFKAWVDDKIMPD